MRAAHAVPARPRPDRPLEGLPPAQAQDAGVRRAGGGPLPHAPHAHARGHAGQPHRRARAAAQRGPDRGDRARARPRAPAVRAHRRGGPRRGAARRGSGGVSSITSTRCGWWSGWSATAPGSTSPSRSATGSSVIPGARRVPRSLEGRIVRLLDRVAYVNHDIDDALRAGVLDEADLPHEPIAMLGDSGAQRIDALVHDVVEASEQRRRHRAGRAGGRGDERAARLHVRAGVSRPGRARRAREDRAGGARAVRPLLRASRRDSRADARRRRRPRHARDRLPRRHDRPLLHPPLRGARRAARVPSSE